MRKESGSAFDQEDRLWSMNQTVSIPIELGAWTPLCDLGIHAAHLAVGSTARGEVEIFTVSRQNQLHCARLSTQSVEGGLDVTLVEIDGTFTSGGPMMGGGAAAAGTKLLGAIVQQTGKSEMVFFKAWGPTATMEKWRASFESFVQSIRPSN